MNLNSLTDEKLLDETQTLALKEREILTTLLHHLREIERRRLYSTLGHTSLFDYAVKKLGYSEDQAYRRISAMRLLKELPVIEEKIASGSLTLSNLSLAQNLFRNEKKTGARAFSPEMKLETLRQLENKSTREAKAIASSLATTSVPVVSQKVRSINDEQIEYRFLISSDLHKKTEKLKGLRAHTASNLTVAELLEQLCDLALTKWDPCQKELEPWTFKKHGVNRYVPVRLKRAVWQKAAGKCQICQSEFALQIDHVQPVALGGATIPGNLRLLCRNCNQRAAIEKLGLKKVDGFLNK